MSHERLTLLRPQPPRLSGILCIRRQEPVHSGASCSLCLSWPLNRQLACHTARSSVPLKAVPIGEDFPFAIFSKGHPRAPVLQCHHSQSVPTVSQPICELAAAFPLPLPGEKGTPM